MKKLILLFALSLSVLSCTAPESESTAKNINTEQSVFNLNIVQSQSYDKCQLENIEDYNAYIAYDGKSIIWDNVSFEVLNEIGNKLIFKAQGDEINYYEFELSNDSKTLVLYTLNQDLSRENECPSDIYYSEKQN